MSQNTKTERGHAPDDRNVDDIPATEECLRCHAQPAAIILVDGGWQCYHCGANL